MDRPTEQIGGRVARQRCPKYDLSAINASLTKEDPAEGGAIELAEFLFIDGSSENRRYCIVRQTKNHLLTLTVATRFTQINLCFRQYAAAYRQSQ